ncbi:MAG: CHAD domain-containing protein [Thermoguttaceae bacterium]|jgi:CHAD domain-containing protein
MTEANVQADKWGEGISPDQSVGDVAHRILRGRLGAVVYWLPLAAERSAEDVEYVHQLRIATRRAVEAVRVFRDLMSDPAYDELRAGLRAVRRAADGARNWDVLCQQLGPCADAAGSEVRRKIIEQIQARRQAAQEPIRAVREEFAASRFEDLVAAVLGDVQSARPEHAKRRFDRLARRYLKPLAKKFLRDFQADLSHDDALHNLRIRAKKLRYAMEIVAVAFQPALRTVLYPQISALQDILGMVNDHAMTRALFQEWLLESQEAETRAFLEGLVLAETRAHNDIRRIFVKQWTAKSRAGLARRFRRYCRRR